MTPPLKRVVMRAPGESLRSANARDWHYGAGFDGPRAIEQFGVFADLVTASGAEIIWIDDSGDGLADAMFTHDPSLVTDKGAVILRMGKPGRMAEPDLHAAAYEAAGIPILGRIEAPGTVEGGDCIWIDTTTLAVGRGVRTNQAGIAQLGQILAPLGVSVLGFDLPLGNGADACLHLMSVMSPLSDKLALVYAPMLPVAFWQLLKDRGYTLVEAPGDEFASSNGLNLNVLALSPGKVIMVDGFPKTRALMEKAGCHVTVFNADALCIPCEGGPTCLTRPVWRE
ncbi:arginine deiminase family protein [Hoeflea sp. YIM 152468]|uniref:dimethylarginine dimethylaminohydrolase family protein n=1 Tax=Hoeflea sp. YIM 152468 TaxID=3031759 RepID=UPI0023DC7B19|nr:arginine deiminase family protein [Hoeflea sp. YIM 152468]MDF1606721.1 arginine deiminase family protein [Hoeflea sp. YIM 152468]